jgi:hypothetical protein
MHYRVNILTRLSCKALYIMHHANSQLVLSSQLQDYMTIYTEWQYFTDMPNSNIRAKAGQLLYIAAPSIQFNSCHTCHFQCHTTQIFNVCASSCHTLLIFSMQSPYTSNDCQNACEHPMPHFTYIQHVCKAKMQSAISQVHDAFNPVQFIFMPQS